MVQQTLTYEEMMKLFAENYKQLEKTRVLIEQNGIQQEKQHAEDRKKFAEWRGRAEEEKKRVQEEKKRVIEEKKQRAEDEKKRVIEEKKSAELRAFVEQNEIQQKIQQAENRKELTEFSKRTNELDKLFTGQWGKLMESLVEGDLLTLLNQRGIAVEHTHRRTSGCHQGTNYEFDIIAVNGTEIVVVEVKTTLRPKDIRNFISRLESLKIWLSEYKDKQVYGAVAWLREDSHASTYAEKRGLFSIRATGSSASIINNQNFRPTVF